MPHLSQTLAAIEQEEACHSHIPIIRQQFATVTHKKRAQHGESTSSTLHKRQMVIATATATVQQLQMFKQKQNDRIG